jgi:hypothetical protein
MDPYFTVRFHFTSEYTFLSNDTYEHSGKVQTYLRLFKANIYHHFVFIINKYINGFEIKFNLKVFKIFIFSNN